jgi:hypothetical protein
LLFRSGERVCIAKAIDAACDFNARVLLRTLESREIEAREIFLTSPIE